MPRSQLSSPMFLPAVVCSLVIGNALDLAGTYIEQPNWEHEGNPIHEFLRGHGYSPGWPEVIIAKVGFCVLAAIGLRQFLLRRRAYYRATPASFREFITEFFYGRPLGWFQTFYRIPRFFPTLLFCIAICAAAGPYYAFLGYDNLAAHYGWPRLGGFWVGSLWFNYAIVIWTILSCAWLCWELWKDNRDAYLDLHAVHQ